MRSSYPPGWLGPWEPADRPMCWVLRDGDWHKGRIIQWLPPRDGHPTWRATVSYMVGTLQYYEAVTAAEVKRRKIARPSWMDEG